MWLPSPADLLEAVTSGPRTQGQAKVDLNAQASRGGQQQASRSLKVSQGRLQASSRLQGAPGPTHYSQQGAGLSQFQHSPHQGTGVRTQSGSF
ncbi:hypothetical protein GOODEAATRI_005748 [Goodea atripinnis]|uniref:Uncharacterized protein n=1 Tax=Goodea atripinnis TaxID=208336 RepID=A0ABV0PVJ8_9TELE